MNHYVIDSYGSLPRKMIAWQSPKNVCVGGYIYGGPQLWQLSRQNQKPHGENKIPHGKTENLTAKTKTSRKNQKPHCKTKDLTAKPNTSQQKPNTSRQKQIPTALKQSYFVFAVKHLVLPWGFWFCREVFCFSCREVFGFAVRYFVFAVRFLVLPWRFCFCREVFGFTVTVVGHHNRSDR